MASVPFGKEMREQFCLSPDYTFTNHGSWGTVPKCVSQEKCRILEQIESNPDKFFRWTKDDLYQEAINKAAEFVHADPQNMVFVNNATTGVNSVVKSLRLKSGEAILVNNLTYSAVRKTCQAACGRVDGAECKILQIKFPIESEDSLVASYDSYLKEHPEVQLAIIDHITSATALVLPISRLIDVCRSHGVMVMIDGAHAPGQLPLNIEEIGADFYTGNLHKWCYVPRGCSVLWIAPRHHGWVSPLLTSHMFGDGFAQEFRNQATIDYSSYLCAPAGLDFYASAGGYDKIHPYTSELSTKAAAMLEKAWGTSQLPVPESMRAPTMKTIKFPPHGYEHTEAGSIAAMKALFDNYKLVMCVCPIEGEFYVRISAQIYNTMADYEVLRDAILDLLKT